MRSAAKGDARFRTRASMTALLIGALVAGCGGGGVDQSNSAPAPLENPAGTAASSPAPASRDSTPIQSPVSPTPVSPIVPAPPPAPQSGPAPAPAPAPVEIKIMALGDSMTAGGEADGSAYRSYRGYLDQQLNDAGYLVDFIGSQFHPPVGGGDPDHEGYGGRLIGPDNLMPPEKDTIYDRVVGNGFRPVLSPGVSPDIIILALGWNSANYRPSDAANQYEQLVRAVQSLRPLATIILATLSPPEGTSEAQANVMLQGFRELNARARGLAAASASDNLLLADLAAGGFQPSDYIADDDIHWSSAGAVRAASIIFQSIVSSGVLLSIR